MIIRCEKCEIYFEDTSRSTVCPHGVFPVNDGHNNFSIDLDAYRSTDPPPNWKPRKRRAR